VYSDKVFARGVEATEGDLLSILPHMQQVKQWLCGQITWATTVHKPLTGGFSQRGVFLNCRAFFR